VFHCRYALARLASEQPEFKREYSAKLLEKGYVFFPDSGVDGLGRICVAKGHPRFKHHALPQAQLDALSASSTGGGVDVQSEYYRYFPYMDVYVADTSPVDNRRTMQVLPASSKSPCYPTNTNELGYIPETNKCYTSVPIESFFPLSSCTIGGYIFTCPRRPNVALQLLYGEDYITPMKSEDDGVGTDSEELPVPGKQQQQQQQQQQDGGQAAEGEVSEITEELLSFEKAKGNTKPKKSAPVMEYGTPFGDIDEGEVERRKARNIEKARAKLRHHEVLGLGADQGAAAGAGAEGGLQGTNGLVAGSGRIAGSKPTAKQHALQDQVMAYAQHNQQWCQKELEADPAKCADTDFQSKCNGFKGVSRVDYSDIWRSYCVRRFS
jgi:hypothetical protein